MARLNSKTAKQLRKAAEYRNQTATPGVFLPSGVHRKQLPSGEVLFPIINTIRLNPICSKGVYRNLKKVFHNVLGKTWNVIAGGTPNA